MIDVAGLPGTAGSRTVITGVAHGGDEATAKGIALSFHLPNEGIQIAQLISTGQTLKDLMNAAYEHIFELCDFRLIHRTSVPLYLPNNQPNSNLAVPALPSRAGPADGILFFILRKQDPCRMTSYTPLLAQSKKPNTYFSGHTP